MACVPPIPPATPLTLKLHACMHACTLAGRGQARRAQREKVLSALGLSTKHTLRKAMQVRVTGSSRLRNHGSRESSCGCMSAPARGGERVGSSDVREEDQGRLGASASAGASWGPWLAGWQDRVNSCCTPRLRGLQSWMLFAYYRRMMRTTAHWGWRRTCTSVLVAWRKEAAAARRDRELATTLTQALAASRAAALMEQ